MMKIAKLFVGVLLASTLMTSAIAANKAVTATNGPVIVQSVAAPTSLFNAGEVGLKLGTGYDIDPSDAIDGGQYAINLTAGVFWFPSKYFGFEANMPFYQTCGVTVDEIQFGALVRVPLADTKPIWRNIAPYVGVGGVYNWNACPTCWIGAPPIEGMNWAYIGKVGVEVRLNSKWGLFTEAKYRNDCFDNWSRGKVTIQAGLSLVF